MTDDQAEAALLIRTTVTVVAAAAVLVPRPVNPLAVSRGLRLRRVEGHGRRRRPEEAGVRHGHRKAHLLVKTLRQGRLERVETSRRSTHRIPTGQFRIFYASHSIV